MCSGKKKNNFTGAQIKEKKPTKQKHPKQPKPNTKQISGVLKQLKNTVWFSSKFQCKFQRNWYITDMMWNVKLLLSLKNHLFSAGSLTFLISVGKSALGVLDFVYSESEILVF